MNEYNYIFSSIEREMCVVLLNIVCKHHCNIDCQNVKTFNKERTLNFDLKTPTGTCEMLRIVYGNETLTKSALFK